MKCMRNEGLKILSIQCFSWTKSFRVRYYISGLFFVYEPVGEFFHGLCPVAYLVFYLFPEFRKALVVALRDEDGVIAEAFRSMLLMGDAAFHDALETIFARAYWIAAFHLYERYYGAETGLAVGVVAKPVEQFSHVGLAVVVGAFSVACRVNPWLTVERVNLKPRVIGETVYMILVEYIFCLLMRVGFQGVASLRNILMATYIGK